MKKNGISLIVLVITIIVIMILASSIILSLSNNNPIDSAEEAKFKSDVSTYNSELSMSLTSEYVSNNFFDSNSLRATTIEEIRTYIPSMSEEVAADYEIQSGKLVYVGDDTDKENWSEEILDTSVLGTNNTADINTTVVGGSYRYCNPVVPTGFKAIDTDDSSWIKSTDEYGIYITDWDKGLVIEDESGNQFVWIPVDGTNVIYEKDLTYSGLQTGIVDDTLPTGVSSENDQITKYGGFYIARYEAGNDDETLVSKYDQSVMRNVDYSTSKSKAESMYNNISVKSGLLTGTMWDTVMDFAVMSGKDVRDSSTWGNHAVDGVVPPRQHTGYSETWKVSNIYDLAGNAWEWTNATYSTETVTDGIIRGGAYVHAGNTLSVSFRNTENVTSAYSSIGFRVALYVL